MLDIDTLVLATRATAPGAFFAFLKKTLPRALCTQATIVTTNVSETLQSDTSIALHTSSSSTPTSQTIVDRCGGCSDLRFVIVLRTHQHNSVIAMS